MSKEEVGFEFEEGNFEFFRKRLNLIRTTPSALPVFLEFRRFVTKFWAEGAPAKVKVKVNQINIDEIHSGRSRSGKLIRILGPVSQERNADQTDEPDCEIAVTNFWSSNPPAFKSPVTCYLNDESLRDLGPRLFEVTDFCKKVVVKGFRSFFYSWKILGPLVVFSKVRCLRNADRLLPLNIYGPNALQSMLYDLRYRSKGALHSCGFTFWAEAKADYLPGYSGSNKRISGIDVRVHEPISNFLFVKQLVEKEIVGVCGQMALILQSSVDDYCGKLDQRFGLFD